MEAKYSKRIAVDRIEQGGMIGSYWLSVEKFTSKWILAKRWKNAWIRSMEIKNYKSYEGVFLEQAMRDRE